MKLSADLLNHLLRQNPWAAEALRVHAGKVIRISVPPLSPTLLIEASGELAPAPDSALVDAELAMSPSAAFRAMFDPEAAPSLVTLSGDMELGAAVGKVLRNLRWDAEADLARVVGDIPAHELSRAGTHIRREAGRQVLSLAGMLTEFWQEEQPQLAKKRHLEVFSRDVDTLRDDTERLAKRLERLERKS